MEFPSYFVFFEAKLLLMIEKKIQSVWVEGIPVMGGFIQVNFLLYEKDIDDKALKQKLTRRVAAEHFSSVRLSLTLATFALFAVSTHPLNNLLVHHGDIS